MIYLITPRFQKGFTLIELMVVIAIMGLLSAVILSALANARLKGRDGKIIQQVNQLRNQIELEYSETGSFAALQSFTWLSDTTTCNSYFSGTNAPKTRDICAAIVAASANPVAAGYNTCATCLLYIGVDTTLGYTAAKNYAIMAYLPGSNVYYCVGNSGRSSRTTSTQYSATGWSRSGCYANP